MTLTKAELADLLFEKVGLNKREAKDMVEGFFDEVRDALEAGDGVKLSGFGNFQLREKPQRPGRNPKTGEEIPITARRVVTFHASQKLKVAVEAFLAGRIRFTAIAQTVARAIESTRCGKQPDTLQSVLDADAAAREETGRILSRTRHPRGR